MKQKDALSALAALGHGTRLEAFRQLVRAGAAGLVAGELASVLEVPAATLSFHLKELANAGLIDAEQEGRFVRYRANFARMTALLGYLTENCCGGLVDCAPALACTPVADVERASPRCCGEWQREGCCDDAGGTPNAADSAAQGQALARRAVAAGLAITGADGSRTPIPIGAVPLVVTPAEIADRRRVAETLTSATRRVARWRMAPSRRQATLDALQPAERRVVLATWERAEDLAVARVDFLGESTLQALEVNATIPAMQGYSDIAAEAWLSTTVADPRLRSRLIADNGSNASALLQALLALYERHRGGAPRTIALLCRRYDAQLTELQYLQRHFETAGFDARLVHPDELSREPTDATLRHAGQVLDLVYRHLFLRRLDETPAPAIEAALRYAGPHGTLVLNPAAPHLEMKSTHALLSQAADDDVLSAAIGLTDGERTAVQSHVPWTRWLQPGLHTSELMGDLVARVAADPDGHVLKRSWSYGGRDVFVGAALQRGEGWDSVHAVYPEVTSWPALAARTAADARGGGFVVQRRIATSRSMQWLCTPDAVQRAEVTTDYAAFASLGATPAWNGVARASTGEIVNLVRGGAIVPVLRRSVFDQAQRAAAVPPP